ncbi:nucleotidyltransferase family protein [Lentibacillus sp. Marseille-P4043]|uniref:nucleotidyltransferase family protein n=1 Tax=Lentibacillus sp. Marseille-P4043 TaxID=2040293 RepID=UPI00131A5BEF|nr:nucleotidyltransferase domain-containing protein [Lentibacillus sp. Marseille-P4043]
MSFYQQSRDQILLHLKNIIDTTLKDIPADVYLFGSWARKEEKRTSDIDVALQSPEEIPIIKWVELRERIEESPLPYRVDLVDLSKADQDLINRIKKEGIQWKGYSNEFKSQTKP